MNNHKVFVMVLVAVMCLGSFSIPNVFSQVANPNVKVLSYSYYVNLSGDFIVVGEVQNTGNGVLQSVTMNATAYDASQDPLAGSSSLAYVNNFLPQQKAPFYIDLGPATIAGTDWGSTVASVSFTAFNAYSSSDRQYEGLSWDVATNGTISGSYLATGFVFNVGNQTAKDVKVVGTFYNSLGTVVAVGYYPLNDSLVPNSYTTYTVSEFDATPSLVAQISNCSILVQTSTLQISNSSSTIPTIPLSNTNVIVILAGTAAAAVIIIIVTLVMFRKRKVTSAPPPPPPPPEEDPTSE